MSLQAIVLNKFVQEKTNNPVHTPQTPSIIQSIRQLSYTLGITHILFKTTNLFAFRETKTLQTQ